MKEREGKKKSRKEWKRKDGKRVGSKQEDIGREGNQIQKKDMEGKESIWEGRWE